MPSIFDMYEYYLEPRDLQGKAHVVKVQSAKKQDFFSNGKTWKKIVLRFVARRKSMSLDKYQAEQMFMITGEEDYTKWVGAEVVLVEDRRNAKEVIRICTREESGDADLMQKKQKPAPDMTTTATTSVRPVNVPLEFWESRSDVAVKYAAEKWKMNTAIAWAKLNNAVENNALSAWLPEAEFKEYVEMPV